jgi:hypothetical protein
MVDANSLVRDQRSDVQVLATAISILRLADNVGRKWNFVAFGFSGNRRMS